MAKFILKWRYIKSGSAKHSANLVKYIATREGVERCDDSWKHQPTTQEQQRLIKELTSDFDAFPVVYTPPVRPPRRSATGGQTLSQSDEPLINEPENYVRTD